MKKKIAIFGGTFDPIHNGHLMIAEQIRSSFLLDEIIFMPSGNPPYKNEVTDEKLRLKMLMSALKANEFFSVSSWEIDKKGFSYSYKLIDEYIPSIDADEVYFIIGSDSLINIQSWYKGEYFLKNGNFIVVNRPNYDLKLILNDNNYNENLNNIKIFDDFYFDISSTYIRDKIRSGVSIRYLIPDSVLKIIKENRIYR